MRVSRSLIAIRANCLLRPSLVLPCLPLRTGSATPAGARDPLDYHGGISRSPGQRGEIVLSHPRFYWGETGNVNMRPWLNLHLPSSRNTVPTGYGYVLPDQNGWSRYLHFQAAWLAVATGLLYVLFGFFAGHFRRNLFPVVSDLSIKELWGSLVRHLRFERPGKEEASSYNALQRMTYLLVVFALFPLMIWTGLAMSMGFTSAFPLTVRLLGGQQTARSLHFLVTILLVLFLLIHVLMVFVAGFRNRVRAMITGRA